MNISVVFVFEKEYEMVEKALYSTVQHDLLNSYILSKKIGDKKLSQHAFRNHIVQYLIAL